MKEIWKDIENYEGYYQISNLGNVKSLSRKVPHYTGCFYTKKEKIMNCAKNGRGYRTVFLHLNGKEQKNVAHLVWDYFGNVNAKRNGRFLEIDHINNIRDDDRINNLQAITHRHNSTKDRKNKHGYHGVSCTHGRYQAVIQIDGIQTHLGSYNTASEAGLTYQEKVLNLTKNDNLSG